ncbi:MAG TPA: helical backbone metal receptor [Polyangiaceae bacterium]|nr:helical backbone metal receptor [Polyangiaceae bacterium]
MPPLPHFFLEGAIAVALALAGCSRAPAATPDAAAAPDAGIARRVVSISPAMTETLFVLGAGDHVVGRSRFCDWPPEALKVPVVGGVIDPDFEAIVQLGPDLLVGGPGTAATALAAKLAPFGVATWFPEVDSLDAIDAMIREMGGRTGHRDDATRVVGALHEHLAAVEHAVAGEGAPRVLFVVDVGPVVATGPHDFVDDLIHRARATNVIGAGASWQTLGFERIVDLDPDVVVDASNANGAAGPSRVDAHAAGWADVRAVREGHVIVLADPRVLRPGPRVAEGLASLAHALHPAVVMPTW